MCDEPSNCQRIQNIVGTPFTCCDLCHDDHLDIEMCQVNMGTVEQPCDLEVCCAAKIAYDTWLEQQITARIITQSLVRRQLPPELPFKVPSPDAGIRPTEEIKSEWDKMRAWLLKQPPQERKRLIEGGSFESEPDHPWLVVCGKYQDYLDWCRENHHNQRSEARYIYRDNQLAGMRIDLDRIVVLNWPEPLDNAERIYACLRQAEIQKYGIERPSELPPLYHHHLRRS